MPLLIQLCAYEETVVREAACQSLRELSENLSEDDCTAILVPSVLRLAEGENFTQKIAAIIVMSSIYESTGENKAIFRK